MKAENYMALAGLFETHGNWNEAEQAAERAHSLEPASPFIANNLAYLYLDHGGDVNAAFSVAQQARQLLLAEEHVLRIEADRFAGRLRYPGLGLL